MAFMAQGDSVAIIGHVGRKGLRFARTDEAGCIDPRTIYFQGAGSATGISGALANYLREQGLQGRTIRTAIAVAGLIRGDTISVTHTRWFVSRSGLQAMLGHPPLLLNDFEAEAWALSERDGARQSSGTWCIAGITSGLGVSVLRRDADRTCVIATEAGHVAFAAPTGELAALVAALFPGASAVPAELLISAPGLLAIYQHLVVVQGTRPRYMEPEAITAAQASDPIAARACELLAQAFWSHMGNLVLAYGAWDGVIATGGLAMAMQPLAMQPDVVSAFVGRGKYARLLSEMPRRFERVEHGELIGAAAALRAQRVPEPAAQPLKPAPMAILNPVRMRPV
ncbi:glucokinase [Sphingomonas sp. IW22]|uniref:glucokinase n=1 Tax=Sphingomonas sp. IW22 TaxID=3242489 RepID=UPI00352044FD